ncbi:MAG: MarR family transcriptional regulator [Oscillospiraceae bacterium]|jgi:DNA-binding MarR family transcriptional regulator|nr:MarR family transcriptional regulator [Oscillospiraceae bacterium]
MKNPTQTEKLFMLFQHGAIFVGRGWQPQRGAGHGQGYVLSLLSEAPMSQKELLEKLGVRAGSLSELLGKLESAGYITRTKDERDSRAVNLAITEAGREFAAEHGRHRTQVADGMFAALDDGEKATLLALLEKLHASWRPEHGGEDEGRGGHGRGHGGRGGFGGFRGERGGHEHEHERGEHGEHGHGERGEHGHGGHEHGEKITDPALLAYLDGKTCGECEKNCKLAEPQCGKGARKQQEALAEYRKDAE